MKPRFFDILVNTSREVFETMSFIDVVQMPAIEEVCELENVQMTAFVCLAGEISGMLALHCNRDFVVECSRLITGSDDQEVAPEVLRDTAGELANMVAGTLKRRISSHLDLFDISLPGVITGEDHHVFYNGAKENFPRLIVPFMVDETIKFYVELLYHKR
ncbi:MAG: chemotaxis protein CheX [Candidatus Sumerlaeia bacterium]